VRYVALHCPLFPHPPVHAPDANMLHNHNAQQNHVQYQLLIFADQCACMHTACVHNSGTLAARKPCLSSIPRQSIHSYCAGALYLLSPCVCVCVFPLCVSLYVYVNHIHPVSSFTHEGGDCHLLVPIMYLQY